jgi:hypothetical protein
MAARVLRSPTAAILASAVAFYAAFIARTGFRVNGTLYFSLFDDSMISMRYARNLAQGHGLVWNPGQHPVEGYTNLLWTLWMAALHLMRIPEAKIALAVMISGVILLIANALVVGAIARRLTNSRIVPLMAIAFTAFYYPLVFWTLRGMEVGLLTFLISSAILVALRLRERFDRRDLFWLAAIFAAALLTRTDAAVYCAIVGIYAFLTVERESRRKVGFTLGAAIVGTIAAHTAFRLAYYGVPLPNTYYLKIHGIGLGTRLHRGFLSLASVELLHLWAPTLIAGGLLAFQRLRSSRCLLLAAVFLGGCAYSVYVGGDAWEWMQYSNRYVTPGVPSLLVLSSLGLSELAGQTRRRWRLLLPASFIAVFLLTLHSWLPNRALQFAGGTQSAQVVGLALAVAWLAFPRGTRIPLRQGRLAVPATAVALLGVVFMAAVEGLVVARWVYGNAASAMNFDAPNTRYALALRNATTADAKIAVAAAGAIPYFSHRDTIDLLGKSDRFIAMGPAHKNYPFLPGHDKWNYRYSIGKLRPDVVAEMYGETRHELREMSSWGYKRLPSSRYVVFVRSKDGRVRRSQLARFLAQTALPQSSIPRSGSTTRRGGLTNVQTTTAVVLALSTRGAPHQRGRLTESIAGADRT